MIVKFKIWLIKKLLLGHGPVMVRVRDHRLFIDRYGRIFKVSEDHSGYDYSPLTITILEK